MTKLITQILLKEKEEIKLARVLLQFDVPLQKYPKFGIWSYLLNSKNGITIFDTGPKYNTLSPICKTKYQETNNANKVIYALDKYFPNKKVNQIILSHYHFDHSECAPELQYKLKEKFGKVPPIRIHKEDFKSRKIFGIYKNNIAKIFLRAGYSRWNIGDFVKHDEDIEDTGFTIKHLPGHTHGCIGLVNEKYNIMIGGWWINKIEDPIVRKIMSVINENNSKLENTIQQYKDKDYKLYYYHPKLNFI